MKLPAVANASSKQSREVLESLPHAIWVTAADGTTEYVNRQGSRSSAVAQTFGGGGDWTDTVHPEQVDRARRTWSDAIASGLAFQVEHRLRLVDGSHSWHAVRGVPVRDEHADVSCWVVTATDIDGAKLLEAELRFADRMSAEALSALETLQSQAPVGIGLVDRDLRFVRLNETLATINGSTVAEQVGQLVSTVLPSLARQLEPLYRQVLDTGEAILDLEVTMPAPSTPDEIRHWLTSYYPVSVDGEIVGVGVVLVDITASKAAEKDLRFQASLVELAGQAIIGLDRNRVVIAWNKAAAAMFGWSAEEAIGRTAGEVVARTESAEQGEEITEALRRGESWAGVYDVRHRDGTPISTLVTNSPIYLDGELVAVISSAVDITERQRDQRALEASQRRLAVAQRIAKLGSYEIDLLTGKAVFSEAHDNILDIAPGCDLTLDLFASMIHRHDITRASQAWAALREQGVPFDMDFRVVRASGEVRFVHARAEAELDPSGTVTGVSGTLMDDTERLLAERARQATEAQFEIGFEQSAIGAVIADLDGLPLRVNRAACEILGRPPDELIGRPWTFYGHPDEVPLCEAATQRAAAGHDTYEDERRYIRPDGSIVWAMATVTLVRNTSGEPEYFFTQLRDTTQRKNLEAELAHQALHDSLTGLPNRVLLTDRLVQNLASSRRRGSRLGVLFLDIDEFKVINDSSGHSTGDELLRHAATRISEVVRADDTVARFGGDEFVVICDDLEPGDIELVAAKVLAALGQPWQIGEVEVRVSASIGVALADDASTPESLLRDSDAAMYRAKERGKGRIEMFDDELRVKAERRFSTASQLHAALERDEFVNHYQPVVDITDGTIVGVEALVRWNHPTRGLLAPAEFIGLAEETGLIVAIGEWVLERACLDLTGWQRIRCDRDIGRNGGGSPSGTYTHLTMAVNLSVRQLLAPGVVAMIDAVLQRTSIPPSSLSLELTESIFMEEVDHFSTTLAELKSLDLGLAIDDFGTGYSSISYLKRFPFDTVKVDRSFVDGLGTDPNDTALVAAIIAMAGALGLKVVAEGVETSEQMEILQGLGVRAAQGYAFAKPMPADDITALIRAERRYPV